MAWTPFQIVIALTMVVTGSINTLSTKWADKLWSPGRDGKVRLYDHPFLQACGMFLGEMSCLLVVGLVRCYFRYRSRQPYVPIQEEQEDDEYIIRPHPPEPAPPFNPLIFLPPAMCDMLATSLSYIGLTLTFASSFQMFRGSLIIFTGFLSVAFLHRRLQAFQWCGMLTILAGLLLVGIADFMSSDQDTRDINGIIAGDLLIVLAQIITATQMVLEEKFVTKHNVQPLVAVGFEGLFGFSILSILLIPMYFIPAGRFGTGPNRVLEDAIDGLTQLKNSWQLCLATFGNVCSIAFFNFAGISVTKELSATTRTVLDSVRTIIIWLVSLFLHWQGFHALQMVGFAVLVFGMCLYNDIVFLPLWRRYVGPGHASEMAPM